MDKRTKKAADLGDTSCGSGQVGSLTAFKAGSSTSNYHLFIGVNVIGRATSNGSVTARRDLSPNQPVQRVTLNHAGLAADHAAVVLTNNLDELTCIVRHLEQGSQTKVISGHNVVILKEDDKFKATSGDLVYFGDLKCQIHFEQADSPLHREPWFSEENLAGMANKDATQPGEFSQTEEVGKPHETESIEVTASPGMPSSCTSSGPEEFQIQSAVPASTIEARSKSLKSDYCQTPGRLVAPPPCLRSGGSPFASPPAQLPTDSAHPLDTELGGIPRTKERQPAANKFMGTRQPSLQEWCADAELLPTRSKSVQAQATQSFELTPHGSPKLTRPGLPIFTPRAPKKSGRRSFAYGQMPLPASRADALSDLLSCDEDLGWSWRSLEQPEREDQAFQKYGMNGAPDHAGSSFDSHSMKLLS